jgi:transposase-like protein
METASKEYKLKIVLESLKKDPELSIRAAAKIYNVDRTSLSQRHVGRLSRRDIQANSRKLTDLEESVIVQHIVDLDSKGCPPRLSSVGDMANPR